MSLSSWWGSGGATNPNLNQQSGQVKQGSAGSLSGQIGTYGSQYQTYQGIMGQVGTYIREDFVLDIDAREKQLEEKLKKYQGVIDEQTLISSLHEKTKEILRLTTEINKSGKFEDVSRLDKFVREQLFNSKFESFLMSADPQPKEGNKK